MLQENNKETIDSTVHELIFGYLLHNNYKLTANSIAKELNLTRNDQRLETIELRSNLYQLITNGEILQAIEYLKSNFSKFINETPNIIFTLKCQHFIELVRLKQFDFALEFAQEIILDLNQNQSEKLQNLVSLLAYQEPKDSSVGFYLEISKREDLAQEINCEIIQFLGFKKESSLSILVKHAELVSQLALQSCK